MTKQQVLHGVTLLGVRGFAPRGYHTITAPNSTQRPRVIYLTHLAWTGSPHHAGLYDRAQRVRD